MKKTDLKILLWGMAVMTGINAAAENLIPGDTSLETEITTMTSGRMDPSILPVHWDEKTAFHGEKSLRIDWDQKSRTLYYFPSPSGWLDKTFALDSSELENGKTYTFSFYAKANKDRMPFSLKVSPNSTWWIYTPGNCHGRDFTAGTKWQRFSYTFKTIISDKAPVKGYSFMLRFTPSPAGSFWFDAFQLTEGDKIKTYQGSSTMDCGIMLTPCPDVNPEYRDTLRYIYYPGEKIEGKVRVVSNDGKGGELVIRTIDYRNRTVSEMRQEVNGGEIIPLKWDSNRRGWFKVSAIITRGGKEVTRHSTNFIVIGKPAASVRGIEPFFGLIGQIYHVDIMKRLGVKRFQIGIPWKTTYHPGLEPSNGVYNHIQLEETFKKAKAAGMKIKFGFSPFKVPSWHLDPKVWAEAKKYPNGQDALVSPETLKEWKRLVLMLVDRYGDDISEFELAGEDNGMIGNNAYYRAKYPECLVQGWFAKGPLFDLIYDTVAETAKEIRKRKPHIKVGIIRPSQGREGTNWIFIEKVLERIGKCFDFFPVDVYLLDPYNLGPDRKSHIGGIDGREYTWNLIQRLLRQYGKNQPVLMSEAGLECDSRYPDESPWEAERARLFAKDFLTTRAYGFYGFDLFGGISGYESDLYNMSPTYRHNYQICMASAAIAAEFVENTVQSKFKRFPGAARLCLYKKHDGSGSAAIWADKGYYFKPGSAGLTVMDMMGNPIQADKDGKYPLSQDPILIRGAKYEALESAIEKGEISQADFCIVRYDIQKKGLLTLRIENTSSKSDLQLEAEIKSAAGTHKKEFSVPSGGYRFVALPCLGSSASVRFRNKDNNAVLRKDLQLKVPIPLGAEPAQFAEVSQRLHILPNEPWTPWSGPEDLSAEFRGSWNQKYLKLEVKVKDDRHFNKFLETYGGDSLQIAIDPESNAGIQKRSPRILGKGHIEVGIALSTKTGKKFVSQSYGPRGLLTSDDYMVVRDEKTQTTLYEVRIPWAKMGVAPEKDMIFGMSLVLFDDDTNAGQEYHAPIGGGITGGKDPGKFLKFILQ